MIWIIYTLISAFFFGIKDILAKKVLNKDVKPIELVLEEFFILFLILILFFFMKIDFYSYETLWHLYLIKALIVFITTELYFNLLEKYEISTVTPLLNLSPIFLLLLSVIFLSEIISMVQFIGILVILFSTYYLEIIIHHHDKENPHTHHFNLILNIKSIFFLFTTILLLTISMTAILDKMILEKTNVYTNMFFTSAIILISSLIGGLLFHEKHLFQKMISILMMLIGVFLIISNEIYPIINLVV